MTGKERTGSEEEEGWRKRELDLRSDRERENWICGVTEKERTGSAEG